ncbi:hypothetical protein PFFCH_05507, partial [Plasmodium falciparum FCH/4]
MNADEPAEIQKTYNDFFYYWVAHMLKDSIHWRTKKLEKCLKNGKTMKCKEWCNNDCECFKKWIGKKENEWKAIKDHFNTQEGFDSEGDKGIPVGGGFGFTHDVVLQENLKLQFLNEDSTQDTQNSLNAEELKHLKQLSEMLQNENAQQTAGATGKKTLMDKLIDYEKEEAKTCLDTHKSDPCPLPEEDKDIPPSADPSSPPAERIDTDADDTASDDEDEDEEEEEEEETEEEDNQKETETVEPAPKEPAVKKEEVKVCETVKSALTIDNLTKACQQKYEKGREKFPNWKCIPTNTNDVATMEGSSESGNRSKRHTDSTVTAPGKSGATTGVTTTRSSGESTSDKGSICVPPRRRRLYIQKLVEWAKNYNTETSQAEGSSEQSVQSTRNGGTEGASSGPSTSEGSAQTASQPNSRPTSATASSHAPNGDALLLTAFVESAAVETFFLWDRYKKEWESRHATPEVGAAGGLLPINGYNPYSGDSDEDQSPEKQLQQGTIPEEFKRQMFYTLADYKDILFSGSKDAKNGVNYIISGDKEMKAKEEKIKDAINNYFSNSGSTQTQPSDKLKSWWETNGEYIWNAMVCALTYKDSGDKGQTPIQDKQVESTLIKDGNPKDPKYQYQTAKLEDESGAMPTTQPPTLDSFIKRPPYFRYLEEWGQNFCKERKKRLEKIKDDCKVENGGGSSRRGKNIETPKCSCYGEDCKDNLPENPSTLSDLKCPGCGRECRKYKQWIKRKKIEFTQQSNAYSEQKTDAQKNNGDNGFRGTLNTCDTAGDFLKRLGPCSKTYNENGNGTIDFSNTDQTFGPAKNCKPCSEFRVTCNNVDCSKDKRSECTGNNKMHITAENIKNCTEDIGMLVSDDNTNGNKFDRLNECKGTGIFTGIRKEQWECGNFCGYVVCKRDKVEGRANGEKQIITIRGL